MELYQFQMVIWSVLSCFTMVKASLNLADGKTTNQSSILNDWGSSKAVDGCLKQRIDDDCCTHTAGGQKEAWWQVDLQQQSVIETVDILYRDENLLKRLAGFEIYLSNTSDWTSGEQCYQDNTTDLASMSSTQNVMCQGVARYVIIYNDRRVKAYKWYSEDAYMELCEVYVNGCPVGKYGNESCNSDCVNCVGNICHPTSGTCDNCADGFFKSGTACTSCPVNCAGKICASNSGACFDCSSGYSGTYCRCPLNCMDVSCPVDTGHCSVCRNGYYGPLCTLCPAGCSYDSCDNTLGNCSQCDSGLYGSYCNQSCPDNCINKLCDMDNGYCIGCNDGYYGHLCTSCPTGCSAGTCDKTSGNCSHCDMGFYGSHCNVPCPENCKVCNMGSGQCEETKAMTSGPDSQVETFAGIGVGAVILVAVVIAVIVVVLRRRKLQPAAKTNTHFDDDLETTLSLPPTQRKSNSKAVADDNKNEYINVCDVKRQEVVYSNTTNAGGVSIDEIRAMIPKKMQNEGEEFQNEFKLLPWGAVHPHLEATKSSNKAKNRFKTTFPYDHSRVVLDKIGNDPDSTYINANYIDSIDANKVYVACQGPKKNTIDDFWRMVWQLNIGKIVMVTHLIEGGNVKCHQYWPDEGNPLTTKHFNITLNQERTYAFYVLREISLSRKKTKEERQVHQFHFTAWPDHGTPDNLELVLFHRRVTSYTTYLSGQIIVHCSAGLGRTGTFIGLDALLKEERKFGRVDISRYIMTMRKDRMNMVQTHEQYIALHELLVEAADLTNTLISRPEFPVALGKLLPSGIPTNQTVLRKEFEKLQTLIPKYDSSWYTAGTMKSNKDKNRTMSNVAVDKFRAFLQSQTRGRTDYINAVLLQSHRSKSGYLMTQFPLADTIDDFWTMVTDYNCENVVVLGTPTEHFLRDESETTKPFEVYVEKKKEFEVIPDVDVIDYIFTSKISNNDETVRVYTMKTWSSDSLLPPSDSSLILLLEQLDSRRRSDNDKPVVVMCRNGCTLSGLFCCVSNARDQMKMDEEVDIFQTSRQIQIRRPQALRNIEQYQYCYNFIGQYLESTNVYIN